MGSIQAGDAPLHDQRRQAVLRPARCVSTPAAELMRYLVWGGVITVRSLCGPRPAMDREAPVCSASWAGVIGGLVITRVSPLAPPVAITTWKA